MTKRRTPKDVNESLKKELHELRKEVTSLESGLYGQREERRYQLSASALCAIVSTNAIGMSYDFMAKAAVSMADALLKELES